MSNSRPQGLSNTALTVPARPVRESGSRHPVLRSMRSCSSRPSSGRGGWRAQAAHWLSAIWPPANCPSGFTPHGATPAWPGQCSPQLPRAGRGVAQASGRPAAPGPPQADPDQNCFQHGSCPGAICRCSWSGDGATLKPGPAYGRRCPLYRNGIGENFALAFKGVSRSRFTLEERKLRSRLRCT
jgi:hypothetical protein